MGSSTPKYSAAGEPTVADSPEIKERGTVSGCAFGVGLEDGATSEEIETSGDECSQTLDVIVTHLYVGATSTAELKCTDDASTFFDGDDKAETREAALREAASDLEGRAAVREGTGIFLATEEGGTEVTSADPELFCFVSNWEAGKRTAASLVLKFPSMLVHKFDSAKNPSELEALVNSFQLLSFRDVTWASVIKSMNGIYDNEVPSAADEGLSSGPDAARGAVERTDSIVNFENLPLEQVLGISSEQLASLEKSCAIPLTDAEQSPVTEPFNFHYLQTLYDAQTRPGSRRPKSANLHTNVDESSGSGAHTGCEAVSSALTKGEFDLIELGSALFSSEQRPRGKRLVANIPLIRPNQIRDGGHSKRTKSHVSKEHDDESEGSASQLQESSATFDAASISGKEPISDSHHNIMNSEIVPNSSDAPSTPLNSPGVVHAKRRSQTSVSRRGVRGDSGSEDSNLLSLAPKAMVAEAPRNVGGSFQEELDNAMNTRIQRKLTEGFVRSVAQLATCDLKTLENPARAYVLHLEHPTTPWTSLSPEIIVTINVYDPVRRADIVATIQVLGSHTIQEICAYIGLVACGTERIQFEEEKDNDEEESPVEESGRYFFVEETFYTDGPTAEMRANTILAWSQEEPERVLHFPRIRSPMNGSHSINPQNTNRIRGRVFQVVRPPDLKHCSASIRLDELTLRLHVPYLFAHGVGAACEHHVTVEEIRQVVFTEDPSGFRRVDAVAFSKSLIDS
ncbi:hypothetical protein HDU93_007219 [Gonapodya sp. JEL0774]|nr:hypothetical protein HDU93_007219 [Gonapodya sp. JEL0774]